MTRAATKAELTDAIADTLKASVNGLLVVQSYDELTEGIPSIPLAQVYPTQWSGGATGQTSRRTMGSNEHVRQEQVVIRIDVYTSQRRDLLNDISRAVAMMDKIEAVWYAQDARPFFGLDAIREYTWAGVLTNLTVNDIVYTAVQYTLTLAVY